MTVLGAVNSTTEVSTILGLSEGGVVRRGRFAQATAGTKAGSSGIGALSNGPDRVSSVRVETGGLICVGYRALWKVTNAGTGALASIWVGGNQLRAKPRATGADPVLFARMQALSIGNRGHLMSHAGGLVARHSDADYAYTSNVPYIFGPTNPNPSEDNFDNSIGVINPQGICTIWGLDAGTYDVEVQFTPGTANLSVEARELWVWTMNF